MKTYDKVDVHEEANVEHEVGRPGNNQAPHVNDLGGVVAMDDEQWNDSVPHTHPTEYGH